MAQSICGHCGVPTHLTLLKFDTFSVDGSYQLQAAYKCDNCRFLSVAIGTSTTHITTEAGADTVLNGRADWSPKKGQSPQFPDVPQRIADAAKEAYSSASIGAYKAAILMARTVIEATAKAKGITAGNLFSKIDAMKDKNLIRPDIAAVAHEIRLMGNDMAHGDIEYDVTNEDANDVLALMSQVLSEVFQGPALLLSVRKRRTARDAK